jgi:hypothetical protein
MGAAAYRICRHVATLAAISFFTAAQLPIR